MVKITSNISFGKVHDILLRKMFVIGEKFGFHILPIHFYSPIPDTRTLKADLWSKPSELVGIHINEAEQLELLSLFASNFGDEYELFPNNSSSSIHNYYTNNDFFGSVDGEILYCMIRHFKPKRIIEIGSGYSTIVAALAIMRNKQEDDGDDCKLVTIDPYPSNVLDGVPGLSEVIARQVQDIPLSEFHKLENNDILFIDSSHVLKIGSDVFYEYLDIIPRLNKGVIVHSHDIFLPSEYHKKWILDDHMFWNEQYLLQSFLAFNDTFKVLWAASDMHLKHCNELTAAFKSYSHTKNWPVSFWIQRIK